MAENIKVLCDREDIVAIADAVREKTGTTDEMTLGGIASRISNIKVDDESVEMCTVTVSSDGYAYTSALSGSTVLLYTNLEGETVRTTSNTSISHTLAVRKNSLLYISTTHTNINYRYSVSGATLINFREGQTVKICLQVTGARSVNISRN